MRKIVKKSMIFIFNNMKKNRWNNIVNLFEKTFKTITTHNIITFFRYIVNIIKILNTKLMLIKIIRIIQLNSKWFFREKKQICKKINRIDQTQMTHFYFFKYRKNVVKQIILQWQNRRKFIMKLITNVKIESNINLNVKNINQFDWIKKKLKTTKTMMKLWI